MMRIAGALVIGLICAGAAHAQIADNAPWKAAYERCQGDLTPKARLATCTAALKEIPEGHQDSAWPHWYMADAKLNLGDFDGALAEADAAGKLQPQERHILNMRCWVRAVANRELDVARKACDDAIAQNPDDPDQWDSTGLVALRQGRWMDAWKAYGKGYDNDKSMSSSLYGRGLAEYGMGDPTSAGADIKLATARKPSVADDYKGYGLTPESIQAQAQVQAKAQPKSPAKPN